MRDNRGFISLLGLLLVAALLFFGSSLMLFTQRYQTMGQIHIQTRSMALAADSALEYTAQQLEKGAWQLPLDERQAVLWQKFVLPGQIGQLDTTVVDHQHICLSVVMTQDCSYGTLRVQRRGMMRKEETADVWKGFVH